MKSVISVQQRFAELTKPDIQRSTFDRSHGYKTTCDAGMLYPIYVDEMLPGDTLKLNFNAFGRLATLLTPIMDNIFMDVHFFSVPNRLVWDNFVKQMGEQDNPGDSTNYLTPMKTVTTAYAENSLQDYMGLPTKVTGYEHSALFERAYYAIYNQWYRDQNIINSLVFSKGDSDTTAYILQPRGKRKDYFTSALPWPQKGPAASLSLLGTAELPVYGPPTNGTLTNATSFTKVGDSTTRHYLQTGSTSTLSMFGMGQNQQYQLAPKDFYDNNPTIPAPYADLSSGVNVTVNAIRQAFQVQKMFEKDARGGTRYTEITRQHFDVVSPDARLQRPEFLGGKTFNININPIAQNSESGTTPQGNLAAMGTINASGAGFTKTFTEHEIVIGIVSFRADLNYQQGLNKMWSRKTRFDYYFPTFAHLGEQAILNKELVCTGGSGDDDVFGYQERWAEYRYKPSLITGQFRSNATASLDPWHLGQDFSGPPALNPQFINENPPLDRVVAVTSEPKFLLDVFFDLKHSRPMPMFSVPGLVDHF